MKKEKNIKAENEVDRILELGKGILIFIAFLISLVIISFSNTVSSKYLYLSICYIIFIASFYFIFRSTLKEDFKDFKKNWKKIIKTSLKYWGYGLIVMMISNLIINKIINPDAIAANEEANRLALGTTPIITVLAMVLFAPFTEELTFRAGFRKAFKSCITFALFSGIIFGLTHVSTAFIGNTYETIGEFFKDWKELLYIIPYGGLGYFLGVAYYKTNNIFSSMSIHCFHNSFTLIILVLANILERFV